MVPKSHNRVLSIIQLLLALGLACGFYLFFTARNRGQIPKLVEELIGVVWLLVVALMIVLRARRAEDVYVGDLSNGRVVLNPGEHVLFHSNFMSGKFFPSGVHFRPAVSFFEWLKGDGIGVNKLLKVKLTNKRFIFGLILGRIWRVVDLSMIQDITVVRGKFPYRNVLVVKYQFGDKAEELLFWITSRKGKRLKIAFDKAIESSF